MKKKALAGILIGLVVLAVGATSAFAAGTGGWHHLSGGRGSCYVDADNDGVCDNCGTAACANCGNTSCGGTCYVDADNDGVCDNQSAVRLGWHAGSSSSGGHSGHGSQGGCHR